LGRTTRGKSSCASAAIGSWGAIINALRSLTLFLTVAALPFVLSVTGAVLSLRAAFDTQVSWRGAPGKAALAWLSAVLLAPLAYAQRFLPPHWRSDTGYPEIAAVSVGFGAAAVGLLQSWRVWRPRREP
jgi:hypothetical protein